MKAKRDWDETVYACIAGAFLLVFIPVLFCIIMFGNTMDYHADCKLIAMFGNKRLAVFAVLILLGLMLVKVLLRKVKFTRKLSVITTVFLGAALVLLYFVNVEVCKCIWFKQGWDVDCVVGSAYMLSEGIPIGTESYYSIYPNNVPIVFVLYRLYDWAKKAAFYPYIPDFIWVQAICAHLSLTGFVTCITIKKLTKNPVAVFDGFVLFTACVAVSPWKMVPYTDMFAIPFPVLALCFYVYYFYEKNRLSKCFCLF